MRREWKPGDVAVTSGAPITFFEREGEVRFTNAFGYSHPAANLDPNARPLVVIDPEDRKQVERLIGVLQAVSGQGPATVVDRWVLALREFANPTPPRPDEPTGLGAVVEDEDGQRWVRANPSGANQWLIEDAGALARLGHRDYADIKAVRVLSEGVTA